ncbi:MAG: peptidoglycan DD-metalloendopeptidase family protein [Geminicoccaceae bacterium]
MKQQDSATRGDPWSASTRAEKGATSTADTKATLKGRTSRRALQTAGVFATAAVMAFLTVGYVTSSVRLTDREERIRALEHDLADARAARQTSELRLGGVIRDLEQASATASRRSDELDRAHETLQAALDSARRQLDSLQIERQATPVVAQVIKGGIPDTASWLSSADLQSESLARRVTSLEQNLKAVAAERDTAHERENAARTQLAELQSRLDAAKSNSAAESEQLRKWISAHVEALVGALGTTGVDVDQLMQRMDDDATAGKGGPFVPPDPPLPVVPARLRDAPGLDDDLSRLQAVQRLLGAMPLAAPLEHFSLRSGFGVRRDPIRRRPAMHTGLDFGPVDSTDILAAGPGQIVSAGWMGSYGNVVEVDHGFGIVTRYAHLKRILVRVGDTVQLHDRVGVMGTTGRSTGTHLHYEVRVDGRPVDPIQFLRAGARLRMLVAD